MANRHNDPIPRPAPPPLTGVVILDLTQIYNGPYATFLLAQAGATVIKIEPPAGEHLRKRVRSVGVTEPFGMLNANKLSMTLDLRTPAGVEALLVMARSADVIVNNFAPDVMDRLGLGVDVLRKANPRLIIASSTGYGSSGPYRDYPAMDLTVQAMSGVMSITGGPDTPPYKAGPALCDFFGGIHLYGAITTALYERQATGHASVVEVSMLSAVFPSLLSSLGMHRRGDLSCKRTGNRHGGLTLAPYNVYPTRDGSIAILTANDAQWQTFARVLGHPHWLTDERFATPALRARNMDVLDAAIADVTRAYAKDDLFQRLVTAKVPCAPVRELDEVVNDPHLHETGMLEWVNHPVYGETLAHKSPLLFQDHETVPYTPSTRLGEANESVLRDTFHLPEDHIRQLSAQGAFGPAPSVN